METFSNRILHLRKSSSLTQQQVADKLGITRAAYCNYEIGIREPSMEILKRICMLFEVTSDYLIGLTDNY